MDLRNTSVRVAARVRCKIIGSIGEKSQTKEPLARVYVEGVGVAEVEDTEIADSEDKSPAVIFCSQSQGTRLLHDALAAESDRLLDEEPGMIDLGRRRAPLLQLEILDGSAQPPELRKRLLRDEFGD